MFISFAGKAQFYNLPADYFFSLTAEQKLAVKDSSIHGGLKPYIPFFSEKYAFTNTTSILFENSKHPTLTHALFNTHLIQIQPDKQNFNFFIDPILNLEFGKDRSDTSGKNLYTNTRGFIAGGHIGSRFYFETLLAENQSMFPDYISQFANSSKVIPGQGRWKTFKTTGYDYAFSSGFVSIQASKHLNIQIGHGKHKIGNGYRSLFLSDNAFNYPYAKFTQQWFKGRLQYSNIYSVFMNLVPALNQPSPGTETLFQKKAASFQYLSVNATKFLNLGLFQGMIWQAADNRNQQHLNWHYFNPVIFTNLFEYHLNGTNNILIGSDFKLKLLNQLNVYGQLMADDLSNTNSKGKAWGYQLGVNYFSAFGVKGLFLQTEFNCVSESSYLYSGSPNTTQSYSHYNQNLAYTPGNGKEMVLISAYHYKRFFVDFKYNYQEVKDLKLGDDYTTSIVNGKLGLIINPAYNLNIYVGLNSRTQKFYNFSSFNNETNYIYLGLKTGIYNLYYDF